MLMVEKHMVRSGPFACVHHASPRLVISLELGAAGLHHHHHDAAQHDLSR